MTFTEVRKNPADQSLRDSDRKSKAFQLIVEKSADAIIVINEEGILEFANPAAEDFFHRPAHELVGHMFGFPLDAGKPQELNIVRPGKDSCVAEMRVAKIKLNGSALHVANLRDITELVQLRDDLRFMSLLDELTGVYNRRGFLILAQQQLKMADRTKKGMFLLFADLDNMKRINDSLGHRSGDLALIDTAGIMKETFRRSDIVARIGGDEFTVLALEAQRDSSGILTARLQDNLDAYTAKVTRDFNLSISLGIAYYSPERPYSIDTLLAQADALMYAQKRAKQKPWPVRNPEKCP